MLTHLSVVLTNSLYEGVKIPEQITQLDIGGRGDGVYFSELESYTADLKKALHLIDSMQIQKFWIWLIH